MKTCARERGNSGAIFDPSALTAELSELDRKLNQPDFWSDQKAAQPVVQRRKQVERMLETGHKLDRQVGDLETLLELFREGESVTEDFAVELKKLRESVDALETETLFSGENDHRNALLTIHPGAGGIDSQDWAEMLLRMYLKWAERKGFRATITDIQSAEEAGIKNVTVEVAGENVFGLLSTEIGVHRLVRLSPFDQAQRRHTSFASVFVTPEVDDEIIVEIQDEDLRIDTYRASGHGGQHINVTDSAVRVTHLPTGLVAQCQNERSQHKNKAMAMKILRSRFYEHEMNKRLEETKKLEAGKADISFGNQIRSYVLHPYQLVKDHRTKLELGNVNAVLDGDLDPFIRACLVARRDGKVVTPAAGAEDRNTDS